MSGRQSQSEVEIGEIIHDMWLAWLLDDPALRNRYRVQIRRGRILAQKEQVHDVRLEPGFMKAEVASDTGERHSVTIRMDMIDGPTWLAIMDAISDDITLAAEILQGKVSLRLIEVFDEESLGLFPYDYMSLNNYCSCSEDGIVCVGTVAAHIHLAEILRADPMKLLKLRGRERDWIIRELRERGASGLTQAMAEVETVDPKDGLFGKGSELRRGFWASEALPEMAFRIAVDDRDARPATLPILRSLGPMPDKTLRGELLCEALEPLVRGMYHRVSQMLERADLELELAERRRLDEAEDKARDERGGEAVEGEEDSLDAMIVAAARQRGSLTTAFVAKALEVSGDEAREYLQYLVSQGQLVATGKGRSLRYKPVA